MKFQNPSMHGSEVMLCGIQKRNGRTHGRMHERPRCNIPLQPSKLGHKKHGVVSKF